MEQSQRAVTLGKRDFSEAFRAFVGKHIGSIEQIEVLLILHANAERAWTLQEVSAILRTSESSISSRLEALTRSNLAKGDAQSGYTYAATGQLHEMVEELRLEYRASRYSVIELVFSRPDPAESSVGAFRLKDDDAQRR